jgi:hypothetical protein
MGTWGNLPTEAFERKPKVIFDINKNVEVEMLQDDPLEFQGDEGAYYVFPVMCDGEEKVIMTSAWTLLKALKIHAPLKGKKLSIVKKAAKLGKQLFEVTQL